MQVTNSTISDSALSSGNKIAANKTNINNASVLIAAGEINLDSAVTENSNFSSGSKLTAQNANLNSSVLNSVNDMNVTNSTINDSVLTSGAKVTAEKTNIKDSFVTGKQTISFDHGSTLDHVSVTLDNVMDVHTPMNTTVHLNDATLVNGTEVHSPKICANRSTIDNSEIIASNDMSIIDAVLRNGSEAKTNRFVHDRYNIVTKDDSTLRVTIENSTLTANQNINIIDSILDGATINASNKVTFNNVTSAGTSEFSATVNPTNTVAITGAHNFKVKAAAADITIDNSDIANNDLTATNSLTVKNSVFSEDMAVNNANTLSMKDSYIEGLNVSNVENINLEGLNATSLNISDSGNIVIKNSDSAADGFTPTIAELIQERAAFTDYNVLNHIPSDFQEKMRAITMVKVKEYHI